MKATADKSPKAAKKSAPPLILSLCHEERERTRCNPLSSDFTQLLVCKAWEDRSSHELGPPPLTVEGRLRTRGSAYRAIIAARPDITCNFPLFSQIIDPAKYMDKQCLVDVIQHCLWHMPGQWRMSTTSTWQQT